MPSFLNQINSPADLKKIPIDKLPELAEEIRREMIQVICQTGGHLASSLGAVEITIALHYILNAPDDVIVWDVGHQAYAHKMLTGRHTRFPTIRQMGGLSGFPNKNESPYDPFTVGHSSTSISNALGLVIAGGIQGRQNKVVVVIGDAALGGGMAFEALNHAGHLGKNLVVILNDNETSISPTIGALSKYLNRILTNPFYNKVRKDVESLIKSLPKFGYRAFRAARRFEEGVKSLLGGGILFEEMGFRYFGPIDGHDIRILIEMFSKVMELKEPALIHVTTKKGRGYKHAEDSPAAFHSTPPFVVETGLKRVIADGEIEFVRGRTYTEVFGEHIIEIAKRRDDIVVITAAMPDGTGLAEFAKQFPRRFFDVGIAEQHAVGFAAGLARGGLRPVVAIYSTFLQRSYDQIVHDIALQDLPVVFCLDRAGIVGEDGPTHHGLFDIAYLRHIPKLVVMAPSDTDELKRMLDFAVAYSGPVAIRYPRGADVPLKGQARPTRQNDVVGLAEQSFGRGSGAGGQGDSGAIELGKAELQRDGKDAAIIAFGSTVWMAGQAATLLAKEEIRAAVVNARFARPLDEHRLAALSTGVKLFITVEEGVLDGGFGSAVLEFLERNNIRDVTVKRMGVPNVFVEHGTREQLLRRYNLTTEAIASVVKEHLQWQRSR